MLYMLTCPLLSFTLLCQPVFAEDENSEIHRTFETGDYIEGLSSFGVTGQVAADGFQHLMSRFDRFAQKYECSIYLWAWQSLDKSGYDSFDAAKEALEENIAEDTVCILYLSDTNEGYIHVGSDVLPNFDTAALTEVLCREDAPNAYYRMAGVFDALCSMAGKSTGDYVTAIYNANGDVSDEAIEQAVLPLHEVFSGYLCVDFYWESEEENSVLRRDRELDYDEIYALWENKLEYYFQDAIYITYFGKTGSVLIDIGEQTGVQLSNRQIQELEAAFQPGTDEGDAAGFAAGVSALTSAVANADNGISSGVLIGVGAVVVLLLIGGILFLKRRTKN